MVSGVEPATPEPVEIHAGDFFHRAEEIIGRRTLEAPAAGIGAEGFVEQFAPENGFAQHDQRSGRLAIGIITHGHQRIRLGHDRHLHR